MKEYPQFEAGLSFLHYLPRTEAVALLRERADELVEQLAYERELCASLQQRGVRPLWLVEVDHAIAMRAAELTWTRQLAEEIESGTLEWPTDTGAERR